jgi:hypothetical protein
MNRRSQHLGWLVMALILVTVPSIYLLESFVPLLIGGPLIAIAAVYGSIRVLAPGGELARSYDSTDRAMAPLGLSVTEKPDVSFETREPAMPGMNVRLRGDTVLSGERNGRGVEVRIGGHEAAGTTTVTVAGSCPEFTARSRDGKVRPGDGAPEAVASALRSVPNSVRWKRVEVEGGPEGIVVTRKKGEQRDWLCDLWLAERLASA